MWREDGMEDPVFTDTLELDLGDVVPAISGPKRPQDKINLTDAAHSFEKLMKDEDLSADTEIAVKGHDFSLSHGDIVIAAITSCTNTSNPSVMVAAGLVARKAHELGLKVKPWVKTSLAPGSQVVTDYLEKAGLQDDLDALGFNLVGYGCTTCIGNSGPLPDHIVSAIDEGDLTAASVLSGNRNFEGRVNPNVKANYLASPPLVVAYALAGSMLIDITKDPIGQDKEGKDVYLKDIWPSNADIHDAVTDALSPDMFRERYADVFKGPKEWQEIGGASGQTYDWSDESTYVQNPPYFEGMSMDPEAAEDIKGASILALLGDSVTTDHISPAGSFKKDSPAGEYLVAKGVEPRDFNSYGSRRGNHNVMMRGTFANIRIRNEMVPDIEGGYTKYIPEGEKDGDTMSIYDAAMKYKEDGTPLVVIAGKEYGTGSSRDWAAKGTTLLGVKAVIAESYERIHRSNLIGMGVLPLQFKEGVTRKTLNLTGAEKIDIEGISGGLKPQQDVTMTVTRPDGSTEDVKLLCRIDTLDEKSYFENEGILHYVLRDIAQKQMKEAAE